MIKLKCPHCGKEVSAGDENAGKKGRCPGCKGLFMIPGAAAAPKPAPAAERRTPPPAADEDDAPPRKKKPADDYDPDDPDAVEELKQRVGVKVVKRKPEPDEDDEVPRKKKPARDDEDDEAIAEAPRRKRPARDDEEDDDDRPARKKRRQDDEDEDDELRARRKRGRDDDEEDDRPRKKRKKRKGDYADCPNCGCRGDATQVSFTWWGGILGPRLFTHVRCNRCGTCYNGKTGDYNTTRIAIYVAAGSIIGIALAVLAILANR